MSASTTPETTYQHLEYRPGSNYREMFLKGRRIRAPSVVNGWIHGPDPLTPEELRRDFHVSLRRSRRPSTMSRATGT